MRVMERRSRGMERGRLEVRRERRLAGGKDWREERKERQALGKERKKAGWRKGEKGGRKERRGRL